MSNAPASQDTNPVREGTSGSPGVSGAVAWVVAGSLALLWGYAVYRLGTLWNSSDQYSYGWFVPLLSLALAWERWARRPEPGSPSAVAGSLFFFSGFVSLLLAGCVFLEVAPHWRLAGWVFASGVVGVTFCFLYLTGGQQWMTHFAFPVLFTLVAVPWPGVIEGPLIQHLSMLNASMSAAVANVLGTPAMRQGTLIQTGIGTVGVDDACSGIRSLQSSIMVALFLGELFRYGLVRRFLLLMGGIGLAFSLNVVRTTYLVRTFDLKGPDAVTFQHDPAGYTIMGVTLVGLLLLAWVLKPRATSTRRRSRERARTEDSAHLQEPVADAQTERGAADSGRGRGALWGMALGCVVILAAIEIGMELWFGPAEKVTFAGSDWTLKLPTGERGFRELPITETVRNMLRYQTGSHAEWRDSEGRPWQLFGFRWDRARNRYDTTEKNNQARGHAPDICLRNVGMELMKDFGPELKEIKGRTFLTQVERFSDRGRAMHVVSVYWEPDPALLKVELMGAPSSRLALKNAYEAVKSRNRGRTERRVIKASVWGMATDVEGKEALLKLLDDLVVPTGGLER
jgi:exosortase